MTELQVLMQLTSQITELKAIIITVVGIIVGIMLTNLIIKHWGGIS